MKKTLLLVIVVSLLLIAGCTTPSPNPGSTPSLPAPLNPLAQGKSLAMTEHTVHTTPNTTFEVWIDSFEVGKVQDNGDQELTIYVAAKNTGTKPIRMVWFCKLTDLNGKTYGGIGISHGGNGARTDWIIPNTTEAARDYVIIRSDRDLATLAKGAVLDVYFMEKPSDDIPVSSKPDYHTSWIIDPVQSGNPYFNNPHPDTESFFAAHLSNEYYQWFP